MIYTGIGSRQTPEDILRGMSILAKLRGQRGDILRSGGADGADDAFERGCLEADGTKEIYLPWFKFNGRVAWPRRGYREWNKDLEGELWELVKEFHPRAMSLSQATCKLMFRNCHQVLGWDLKTPTEQVVFWAPEFKADKFGNICDCSGGTGFAVRLAHRHRIDIFTMGIPSHVRYLMRDFYDK